jgi:hypothetical protein
MKTFYFFKGSDADSPTRCRRGRTIRRRNAGRTSSSRGLVEPLENRRDFPTVWRIWVDIRKGVSQREVFAGLETPAVGAKPIWARGNARHHADLQSLAYNAAQWGTHIRRRNRKCSDGAAAVLRSLAAAIRALAT